MIQEHPSYRIDGPERRETPSERGGRYQPPIWVRVIGALLVVSLIIPAALGLVAGILAVVSYATPPATTRTDQTFQVAHPTLRLDVDAADVTIATGSAGQISVYAVAVARGLGGSARDALDHLKVAATQTGDTITISQPHQTASWPLFGFHEVRVTIITPEQTDLSATMGAGSLHATGLQGTADVHTGAGDVELDRGAFTSARIETSAGTIVMAENSLNNAAIRTSAGSVRLDNNAFAGTQSVRSSAGNIDISGSLAAHSSLVADTSAGNVTVTLPAATDAHLTARTAAGSVTVTGWPIPVTRDAAEQSANGDLSPSPTSSILLTSSAGNISLLAR